MDLFYPQLFVDYKFIINYNVYMHNKKPVDKIPKYLLAERKRLMWICAAQGYSRADIARIFRMDKGMVTRIFTDYVKEYKEFILDGRTQSSIK